MNRRDAWLLACRIGAERSIRSAKLRRYQGGSYSVEATDLATGIPFVIHSPEAWEERRQATNFDREVGSA